MTRLLSFSSSRTRRKGFALILVLITVALATLIAIFFLSTIGRERKSIDLYAQQNRTRQLSDTAVNLVIGQIDAATKEGTNVQTNPISWASQPGMIRTYKNDGTLSNAYKLYSWDNLVEQGTTFNPNNATAELPPTSWETNPAQFTDLNQPVNNVYPIADPTTANFYTSTSDPTQGSSNPVTWDFPGEFSIAQDQSYTAATGGQATVPNLLPMPVKWIYVLQDGTWTVPTNSTGTTVSFTGQASSNLVPSATNPIVGRIAFWTDDETSKVNVNTASEGSYWDWPKAATADEMAFSGNPPVKGEFQRFSGHPATTSLSAVFPELRPTASAYSKWNSGNTPNTTYTADIKGIYDMIPKLGGGTLTGQYYGSLGGTFPINNSQFYTSGGYALQVSGLTLSDGGSFREVNTYGPIPMNGARLYTTADDFWYQSGVPQVVTSTFPGRTGNTAMTTNYTDPQAFRRRLFFLTANSRAPETTLFETPRVSLWPVTWPYPSAYYQTGQRGTPPQVASLPVPNTKTLQDLIAYVPSNIAPQEQLLAFDATLNQGATTATTSTTPLPYYFQRQSADSPTYDWSSIKRNRQLANYIRGELDAQLPGFGLKPSSKWDGASAGTTDWITLNCFDYSRSMVNQYTFDPVSTSGNLLYSYTGIGGRHNTISGNAKEDGPTERNAYAVTPLRVQFGSDTPSFKTTTPLVSEGAYPTLKEAAVVFYASARREPIFHQPSPPTGTTSLTAPQLQQARANPFYWENLICPDTGLSGTFAPTGWNATTTPVPPNVATWTAPTPQGSGANTQYINASAAYPHGHQTTQMKAVMLFHFQGMRNIVPYGAGAADFSPSFWVNVAPVSGDTGFTVNGTNINLYANNSAGTSVLWQKSTTSGNPDFTALFQAGSSPVASKIFAKPTSGNGGTTNWALSSDPITMSPTNPTFTFAGGKVKISIYACYADNPTSGLNPDLDPTGDSNQLVTSYVVDFSKWNTTARLSVTGVPYNGQLPVPIAPRWNASEAAYYTALDPAGTGGTVALPSMPYPKFPSATASSWMQTEVVPSVNATIRYNWASSSYPAADIKTAMFSLTNGSLEARDIAIGSNYMGIPPYSGSSVPAKTLDGYTIGNPTIVLGNWMSYAYHANQYNYAATSNSHSSTTPFSTAMENRVLTQYYTYTTDNNTAGSAGLNASSAPPAVVGVTLFNQPNGSGNNLGGNWEIPSIITPYDTVVSMIIDPNTTNLSTTKGDSRLAVLGYDPATDPTLRNTFDSSYSVMQNFYTSTGRKPLLPSYIMNGATYPRYTYQQQFHQLGSPGPTLQSTGFQLVPTFRRGANNMYYPFSTSGSFENNATALGQGCGPDTNASISVEPGWDWTSQPGNTVDGGFIERADQDYQALTQDFSDSMWMMQPYFLKYGLASVSQARSSGTSVATSANFFSPNRQISSPVVLGTLPSSKTVGWQTLAFSPNPAAVTNITSGSHPGVGASLLPDPVTKPYSTLPDHLLLDLFWMPVAEPYPISEQFSTAGKVNLNYAMMPFPYIKRKTAMDALLKAVSINALHDTPTMLASYKSPTAIYAAGTTESLVHSRWAIDVANTLKAFDYKFQKGDIFRSASQVCDMYLYPADPTTGVAQVNLGAGPSNDTSNIINWWAGNGGLTSDNGREAPYNAIYSRVTTKSNTYTVHWRVQALRKSTNTDPTAWDEIRDQKVSDLRGSTLIERYLDPNANAIPDYADYTQTNLAPLSYYYKWRVASENYFRP